MAGDIWTFAFLILTHIAGEITARPDVGTNLRSWREMLRSQRMKFASAFDLDYRPAGLSEEDDDRRHRLPPRRLPFPSAGIRPPFDSSESGQTFDQVWLPPNRKKKKEEGEDGKRVVGMGAQLLQDIFQKRYRTKDWSKLYEKIKSTDFNTIPDTPQDPKRRWKTAGLIALSPEGSGVPEGRWHHIRVCGAGGYAHGIKVRVLANATKEEVARVAATGLVRSPRPGVREIALSCQHPDLATELVATKSDSVGRWSSLSECGVGSFLKAVRLRRPRSSSSGRGISGVEAFCSQSGLDLRPAIYEEEKGEEESVPAPGDVWGAYQSCPDGEVVCGVQSRFGRTEGVVEANFFCCPLPEDFYEAA